MRFGCSHYNRSDFVGFVCIRCFPLYATKTSSMNVINEKKEEVIVTVENTLSTDSKNLSVGDGNVKFHGT